jgi:hypothetical protein
MKLSLLLAQRQALLRQARLADQAFAYRRLGEFASRIARAGLRGEITLKQPAPEADCFCASLTALSGSQSVIEEHFTDEDVLDLADLIAFATGENPLDLSFPIEELADRFLAPLRRELEDGGVSIDPVAQPVEESNQGG